MSDDPNPETVIPIVTDPLGPLEALLDPPLVSHPESDEDAQREPIGLADTSSEETDRGDVDSPLVSTAAALETAPVFEATPALEAGRDEVALASLIEVQAEQLANLRQAFDDKLAFDRHKEKQIDLLHRELQEHKRGLLAKAQRPLLNGMVRLHDSLGRVAEALCADAEEPLTHERTGEILQGFQEDVEILLEDQGIQLFRNVGPQFDPHRQTVVQGIPTDDETQNGRVARCVRPGFEQDGTVLQKERVEVFHRA